MQTPPGYGPPRPKNNSLSIILISVSLVCILMCGVGTFFGVQQFSKVMGNVTPMIGCAMDLEAVRDAVNKYAKEKGHYPNAETWQDDLREYVRSEIAATSAETKKIPFKIQRMNVDGQWGCMTAEQGQPQVWSTFVFNKAIAGKKPSEVTAPDATVAIFEAPGAGKNECYEYGTKKLGPGPKIMGDERPWLKITLEGEADAGGSTIKVGTSKSSSSKP